MERNCVIIDYKHSHEVTIDAWETYKVHEEFMNNYQKMRENVWIGRVWKQARTNDDQTYVYINIY